MEVHAVDILGRNEGVNQQWVTSYKITFGSQDHYHQQGYLDLINDGDKVNILIMVL